MQKRSINLLRFRELRYHERTAEATRVINLYKERMDGISGQHGSKRRRSGGWWRESGAEDSIMCVIGLHLINDLVWGKDAPTCGLELDCRWLLAEWMWVEIAINYLRENVLLRARYEGVALDNRSSRTLIVVLCGMRGGGWDGLGCVLLGLNIVQVMLTYKSSINSRIGQMLMMVIEREGAYRECNRDSTH